MKIGIITILNVNNYGAELQAFALHHKLHQLGFENEIINYLYYKNPAYKKELASKPIIKIHYKNTIKDKVLGWIDKYSALRYPAIAKVRKQRFTNFHKEHTKLSKTYHSYSELYNSHLEYDIFIVGSDQVWNPNNGTNLAPYFLTFAPLQSKKIAYASSFGVSAIPKPLYSQYKVWLENLHSIGTRESDGVKIIKEISGRTAQHVVDPTLLLSKNDWEKLVIPYQSKDPYILLFVFKRSDFVMKLAHQIQKKTGYKIIRICKNEMPIDTDKDIINIRDFGPSEFLGLYANASFVITTSYHGTIFSLIFQKFFYVVTPASKNNNSRQESLLEMLDLKDRLIREGDNISFENINNIDYNKVTIKLTEKRKESEDYLLNSLKEQ